jgi:glycosyltransferase involved in cell wall biosynthesis
MENPAKPLVTIGIPTYNRADGFLKDAIESALAQTYPHIEIIVSDNCSSDDTSTLVRSYVDPRLQYHRHASNIGPDNNFNFCLQQAKGDYFILLHDDDLIDPDFVDACMQHAHYSPEYAIIRTGVRAIDEQGRIKAERTNGVVGQPFEGLLMGWFNHQTSWYFCNTMFNTAKLKSIGGLQSKRNLLQDCVAIVKLAASGDRVDVEAVKASFRKHAGEITFAVKVKDWVDDFVDLTGLIESKTHENPQIGDAARRFFSLLCYRRAAAVKQALSRMTAYLMIYHAFGYRRMPPPLEKLTHKLGGFS